MTSNSESITSTIALESTMKIKCHSSKQLFCRGDICFIEYNELSPTKTDYGCLIFDPNIDQKCNKTIDSIHRECCSTTFCNSRLFNYEISHRHNSRWSIANSSSIDNPERLFSVRYQLVLKIIVAAVFFSLLCTVLIYFWKERIKRICQNMRSSKLQPILSPTTSINIPKSINSDKSIHLSTDSMGKSPTDLTPSSCGLLHSNEEKSSEMI